MDKKVFVTGIGLLGPCGNTTNEFWEGLLSGKSFITNIEQLDKDIFPCGIGGRIENIEPEKHFPKRLLNKCSRFSVLSLLAAKEAILDAGLDMDETDKTRMGIFVGNNSGGWESARKGLEVLHKEGPQFVSPFLASNWFPAAAQGHISLAFGIKGYSKTVIADRVSSLLAIAYGAKAIRSGRLDTALVGGVETPLDQWALPFYESSGLLCRSSETPEKSYRPFDKGRRGMVLGEGAAFMLLESEESIRRRRAWKKIKASIQGFSMLYGGAAAIEADSGAELCLRTIRQALQGSEADKDDLRLISLDGAAVEKDDRIESEALNKYWGNQIADKLCICPKAAFGNTIGASGAFDAAISILSMKNLLFPSISNLEEPDTQCSLNFVRQSNMKACSQSALILSRGIDGISAAMVINNGYY